MGVWGCHSFIHPWNGNQSNPSVQTQTVLSLWREGGEGVDRGRQGALDLHGAPVGLRGPSPGQGAVGGPGGGGGGGVRDAGSLHGVPPDADVLPPSLQDRAKSLAAPSGERAALRAEGAPAAAVIPSSTVAAVQNERAGTIFECKFASTSEEQRQF